MASAISANRAELLAIATAVATEKMIDKSIVIEAMEEAIQKSARNRYGAENDIRAKLDPRTGDLRLWRVVEVVEVVEDYFKQVDLKQAEKLQKGAAVGDFIVDPLPRWIWAASTRRAPSRSSSRRCAMPSATASMPSSRTARAKSSPA
jgi:N utilization substance protein A